MLYKKSNTEIKRKQHLHKTFIKPQNLIYMLKICLNIYIKYLFISTYVSTEKKHFLYIYIYLKNEYKCVKQIKLLTLNHYLLQHIIIKKKTYVILLYNHKI